MSEPPSPSRARSVFEFLGLGRDTAGLLAMVVLVGMGERIAERFLPIYILALGGGALAIGSLQAMDNFLSALYSLPGGSLADRIGARRALVLFDVFAMIGFAIVIVVPSWQAVLAGAVFFIAWSSLSLPATLRLIFEVLPERKRTMGVTMHSLVRRVPMAVGPIIGGVLIGALGERNGVRAAFIVALLMAVAGLALQLRLVAGSRLPAVSTIPRAIWPGPSRPRFSRMDPRLKTLLLSDIFIRFCEQIPYAFVVVWCMKTIDRPVTALEFGLLTSVEMATSILVYIPVAWLADRGTKAPFVLTAFAFFTLFPVALFYSRSIEWLVVAFVCRGLKELGEPTRKALIMDLSPEDCRAGAFGLYYLIRDGVVTLGPIAGAFLWRIDPAANLLTAFGFGLVGTIGFALAGISSGEARCPREHARERSAARAGGSGSAQAPRGSLGVQLFGWPVCAHGAQSAKKPADDPTTGTK